MQKFADQNNHSLMKDYFCDVFYVIWHLISQSSKITLNFSSTAF